MNYIVLKSIRDKYLRGVTGNKKNTVYMFETFKLIEKRNGRCTHHVLVCSLIFKLIQVHR